MAKKKSMNGNGHGGKVVRTNLSSLGLGDLFTFRIEYDTSRMQELIHRIINQEYNSRGLDGERTYEAEGLLFAALPLMAQYVGLNLLNFTMLRRQIREDALANSADASVVDAADAKFVNDLIAKFESELSGTYNEKAEQLKGQAFVYPYNALRSQIGVEKRNAQAERVKKLWGKLQDSRLSLILGETVAVNLGKGPKPDGIVPSNQRAHRTSKPIWVYLRYGDSDGGSQGDRRDNMYTKAMAYPHEDFIFFHDGLEVRDAALVALNTLPNCVATRSDGTVNLQQLKQLVLALYDRP